MQTSSVNQGVEWKYVTALVRELCRMWGLRIVRHKQLLNLTIEIGHASNGCTQSQGPVLDEDLS